MLTYFPTPYPDEWWYSVLCRYHVRSGNTKHMTTSMDLFGKTSASISSLYPNFNIRYLLQQLPNSEILAKEAILNHTLFRYYTRFKPLDEKRNLLKRAMSGEQIIVSAVRRFSGIEAAHPKYCPICAASENEPYWHIDLQIPMITHCPKHGCILIQSDIGKAEIEYGYFPLSSIMSSKIPSHPCVENEERWQRKISRILDDYYSLPFETSISKDCFNLVACLSNAGYDIISRKFNNHIVKSRALYYDLQKYYGSEIVAQQFGANESSAIAQITRMCNWKGQVPERYAMLQTFIGFKTSALFSKKKIENIYMKKISEILKEETIYTKKQIEEKLGISALQLDNIVLQNNLEPFWRQSAKSMNKPNKLRCSLSDEDYNRFEEAFRNSGYRYKSEFVEHLIMKSL